MHFFLLGKTQNCESEKQRHILQGEYIQYFYCDLSKIMSYFIYFLLYLKNRSLILKFSRYSNDVTKKLKILMIKFLQVEN